MMEPLDNFFLKSLRGLVNHGGTTGTKVITDQICFTETCSQMNLILTEISRHSTQNSHAMDSQAEDSLLLGNTTVYSPSSSGMVSMILR